MRQVKVVIQVIKIIKILKIITSILMNIKKNMTKIIKAIRERNIIIILKKGVIIKKLQIQLINSRKKLIIIINIYIKIILLSFSLEQFLIRKIMI